MWNTEILEQMLDRGFELKDGNLEYASGSVANYVKVKVYAPSNQCSLARDEKYVPACHINYEEFQEPGYLEVDHHTIKYFSVAEEDLAKWAKEKHLGISTEEKEERRKQWEERKRRMAR